MTHVSTSRKAISDPVRPREDEVTLTKFYRMRIYRKRKWKREGHQQCISWRDGDKTWRILRLPERSN